MKSRVVKRSIMVGGHKTSVSLEDNFWSGLKEIVESRATTLTAVVAAIDAERRHTNLSSAIRLYVLEYFRSLADAQQHGAAQPALQASGAAPALD